MSNNTNNGGQNMDAESQEMLQSFVSEAFDSLDTNEPLVENLRAENNSEHVNAIFRVFHTLKGLSGFFEMYVINKVTHEAETLLDIIRKQDKVQTEETMTVIYQCFDFLRDLLQRINVEFTDKSGEAEAEDMIIIIKDAIENVKSPMSADDFSFDIDSTQQDSAEAFEGVDEVEPSDTSQSIPEQSSVPTQDNQTESSDEFDFASLISDEMLDQYLTSANELVDTVEKNLIDLEKDTENAPLVAETFGAVHSLKGNSGFMGFSEIEEISVEMETILDSIRSKALDIDTNIITILLSNTEVVRKRLDAIGQGNIKSDKTSPSVSEGMESPTFQTQLQEVTETIIADTPPVETKPVVEEKVESKPEPPKQEKAKEKPAQKPQQKIQQLNASLPHMQKKDIRVETTKIDKLFDLVGELITIETMVTNNQDLAGLELPNFSKSANMLNKITRELQEISMSIRMMPLDGLFNKMKRLVRDVSIKMNKKVNLVVYGQQTEMDKNVIDEISDPLVHILRNAVDHGIEIPEVRASQNKSEEGTVTLGAKYEGNEILIIVEDDGAGIKRESILKKAEEKGILKVPPESMSDKEVFALVFEPGFSTAKEVTDISGRGVGMDVVRKNIEKLRGSIDINSSPEKGSRITLRIPLTLAIMEAMVIKIGQDLYALPILALRESFRPQESMITITMDGLEVVKVREEILPIIRLHEIFNIESANHELHNGILLIIESKERKVCLFADDIVGQQQAVIKGFSDYIGKVPGITGCMVTGDGSIGLILDIESLLDLAQTNEYVLANN